MGKEVGKGRGGGGLKTQRVCLSMRRKTENFFSLLISTQSVAFWCPDFLTALYFVNQRNFKTLAMQIRGLTRTRYFCSLNVRSPGAPPFAPPRLLTVRGLWCLNREDRDSAQDRYSAWQLYGNQARKLLAGGRTVVSLVTELGSKIVELLFGWRPDR
jgi:hypothetical protein